MEDPVTNGTDSTKSVIYQDLIAVLTMVMQEQNTKINKLESQLESFIERLERLERGIIEGNRTVTILN